MLITLRRALKAMMSKTKTSFRSRAYNETLTVLNQFTQLAGITRLADITHLDYTGIPVYTAIRPRAKSLTTSQGKGLTTEAAKCSALMESIEVFFAEELIPEVMNKSELELTQSRKPFIPINYLSKSVRYTDPGQKFDWVNAYLVLSGKTLLVPFAEYSLNSYLPEILIYSPDTTGLSGGNDYKEALLHGILEVIERQSPLNECEVVFIEGDLFKTISNHFESKIYYLENVYGIPSFDVLIKSKKMFDNQILFKGHGCHLNKEIALNRALTEAVQSRVTTIAGSRDDLINTKYDMRDSEFPADTKQRKFSEIMDYPSETINDALNILYEKIKRNNQEILVYKYYDKEICILKVKLISKDLIQNV